MSFNAMPIIPQNAEQAVQRDNLAGLTDPNPGQQIAERDNLKLAASPSGLLIVSLHGRQLALSHDELVWLKETAQEHQSEESE